MWSNATSLRKLDYSQIYDVDQDFILNETSHCLFTNLQTLKLSNIFSLGFDYFKSLAHLRALHIHLHDDQFNISREYFEKNYGINLSIIEYLKELQLVKLCRFDFLNCQEIQEKYPHVRILWKIYEPIYLNRYLDGFYEGPFSVDNKREGNGTMWYKEDKKRARYEGGFKNDMREGKGTFVFFGGWKYEGEWKNDLREDKGIEFDRRGNRRYEGEWKEDLRAGKGIDFHEDGGRYEGEFMQGFAEGVGVYFSPNGSRYEGQFKQNCSDGKGIIYYTNGNRYEGQFEEGDPVGRGTLILANCEEYEGDAKNFDNDNGVFKTSS